jgi:uncharacterized repeat protein (TIGR03803 family)
MPNVNSPSLAAPTETVLYSFTGSDGAGPLASLIADSAGNLYGTTSGGGTGLCNNGTGCGVVFKVSPSGTETVLHSFMESDGAFPEAGLITDNAGNGTTAARLVWCSSSRRAGPRRCCTPLRAATGVIPKPA